MSNFEAITDAMACGAGRVCDCRHGADGTTNPYACPHCGCACSWPDPQHAPGDPDACPCCWRHVPTGGAQ